MNVSVSRDGLISRIRALPTPNPKGLSKMRKPELEQVLADMLAEQDAKLAQAQATYDAWREPLRAEAYGIAWDLAHEEQARREVQVNAVPLHEQPMADSPAAVAQTEEAYPASAGEPQVYQGAMHEDDAEDDPILLAQEAAATSYDWEAERDDLMDVASEAAYAEMAAQVDALVERELAAERHREMIKERARVATQAYARYTATVQSMGRAVRGKVVGVVLRPREAAGHTAYDFLLVVQHDGHPHRRTLHDMGDVRLAI